MKRTSDPLLSDAASEPDLARLCDEIIERLQAGDRVDLMTLTHEHPEHADRLRRLLPALEALVDLGASAVHPASRLSRGAESRRMPTAAPRVLGDYRILREIGRGGMGVVYEAEQRSLNRRVALKVLPMAAALDGRQFQRFQLEAQAAACLHHNNIVPVFAVGTEGGVPYYAMQFIEGRSLADVITELRRAEGLDPAVRPDDGPEPRIADLTTTALARSLLAGDTGPRHATGSGVVVEIEARAACPPPGVPPATAAAPVEIHVDQESGPEIAARPSARPGSSTHTRDHARTVAGLGLQAAEALDHAHTRGILHRDIKPGNLLLDADGRLWIADFGLAQIQGNHGLTLTGDVLGTLRYMSPEQALAKRVVIDGRTDIYSLGVTLYELLTLQPAVGGEDRAEILRRIADREPPSSSASNPAVPRDLETVVRKAMAKEPAERYATARDLADDLRRFLDSRPIAARPPSLADRVTKWARRHSAGVVTGVAFLVLAMAALGAGTFLINHERAEAVRQRDEAQRQREFARRAVDEMYTQVAEKWLSRDNALSPLQRQFLEKALAFYEEFARQKADDPEARADAARAAARVGQIRAQLGLTTEAMKPHRQALDTWRLLAAEFPGRPEYRRGLAHSLIDIGALYTRENQTPEAEQAFREALALRERLSENPGLPDDRMGLSDSLDRLGTLLRQTGREGEAEKALLRAIGLMTTLAAEFPKEPRYQSELAAVENSLGTFYRWTDRYAEAEAHYRRVLDLGRKLVDADPVETERQHLLVVGHDNLGNVFRARFEYAKAAEEFRLAFSIEEKLATEHPDRPRYREEMATTLLLLSGELVNLQQYDEAERAHRRSREISEKLAAEFPEVPGYREKVAWVCQDLGRILAHRGRSPEARHEFERGYEILRKLLADHPDVSRYRQNLAALCFAAAVNYATLAGHDGRDATRARELARESVELKPKEPGFWKGLALAEYRAGDLDAALKAETKVLELRKSDGYAYDWLLLALIHLDRGDRAEARKWAERVYRGKDPGTVRGSEPDFIRLAQESEARLRAIIDDSAVTPRSKP